MSMAVIIKNTFLEAVRKDWDFDEPCTAGRRCQSLPREWKPSTPCNTMSTDTSPTPSDSFSCSSATDTPELMPHLEPDQCTQVQVVEGPAVMSASRQEPATVTVDTIVNALHSHLTSCSQIRNSKINRGLAGKYPVLITADLYSGPRDAHDVMHLTRRALNEMTARLQTICLLSTRLQKEDCGYSLRASLACVPDGREDYVCWDMFRKGYCPRRSLCRWYHPQDSDTAKIKVSIRCSEEAS